MTREEREYIADLIGIDPEDVDPDDLDLDLLSFEPGGSFGRSLTDGGPCVEDDYSEESDI
jgi:hypothetical protein